MTRKGKHNQKKHTLLLLLVAALSMVSLLALITRTFAFFTQESSAENFLYAKILKVDLIDDFDGNGFVLPGDTLNKDVSLKNNGEVDAVIRVKLTPSWDPIKDSSSQTLDLQAVIVTPAAPTDWTLKSDGWWYYNKILKPGESTSLLVDALKLKAVSNDSHDINYEEARYQLNVTSQSLQAQPQAAIDTWSRGYTLAPLGYITWS